MPAAAVESEETKVQSVELPGLMSRMQDDAPNSRIAESPVRKFATPAESPSKFSHVKATLAIRQESVSKELDSILGDSPSPSKQVERTDWTLVSPEKFAFRLAQVEDVEEVSSE